MKKWSKFLTALLAVCLLLPLAAACTGDSTPPEGQPPALENKSVVFDQTLTIIYAQANGEYAQNAASLLREALRDPLGYRPTIVTDRAFQGDVTADRVFLIGNVTLVDASDKAIEGDFSLEILDNGAHLNAKTPIALYMAAQMIAELWPTAEYGCANDTLTLTSAHCRAFVEKGTGANAVVSVMSQNIRCANDGNGNDIVDRKERFKKLMNAYQPDLLGTQEVTAEWNTIFEDYFGDEYGMVGCSRDGYDAVTGEWNTILYKKARFDLVDSGTIWLTATPFKPSHINDSLFNRICTWAILLDKTTGKEIFFANTHLDHSTEAVRSKQVKYLMSFLESYMDEYPVYLTGDFNTGNKTESYRGITAKLTDAHKSAALDLSEVKGTFHGYGNSPSEIDFCFHSTRSKAIAYRILSETYGGYVSDHYGLISYFTFE